MPIVQHLFGIDEDRRRDLCKFKRSASEINRPRILRKNLLEEPIPEKYDRLRMDQRNFLFEHLLEKNRNLGKNDPVHRFLAKIGDADSIRGNLEAFEHPSDHLSDIGTQVTTPVFFDRRIDDKKQPRTLQVAFAL